MHSWSSSHPHCWPHLHQHVLLSTSQRPSVCHTIPQGQAVSVTSPQLTQTVTGDVSLCISLSCCLCMLISTVNETQHSERVFSAAWSYGTLRDFYVRACYTTLYCHVFLVTFWKLKLGQRSNFSQLKD